MSELFGNPEQVSELSGNSEQLPYTPTTEEVRQLAPLTDEEFDRWLAEVKAEAWDEGWCRCFDSDGYKTDNPYRRGETE